MCRVHGSLSRQIFFFQVQVRYCLSLTDFQGYFHCGNLERFQSHQVLAEKKHLELFWQYFRCNSQPLSGQSHCHFPSDLLSISVYKWRILLQQIGFPQNNVLLTHIPIGFLRGKVVKDGGYEEYTQELLEVCSGCECHSLSMSQW